MPRVDRAWPETAEQLKPGDLVKKTFNSSASTAAEGMWVEVRSIHAWGIVGFLSNTPDETYVPQLEKGSIVAVNLHEILDWVRDHE